MNMRIFGVALLALGILGSGAPAQTVSLESLLREMTDRTAVARVPSPAYTCAQASSYDRASTSPDHPDTWFANGDVNQFIRQETTAGRTEYVLMDAKGPGAIVRFWSANPPKDATVRFYFDGAATPGFEAGMQRLLGGGLNIDTSPLGEPLSGEQSKGWNLYLPIPYASACKVTCDKPGFYYQINYRTYAPGTRVETFDPERLAAASQTIQETQKTLTLCGTDEKRPDLAAPVLIRPPVRDVSSAGAIKPAPGESFGEIHGELTFDQPAAITQLAVKLSASDRDLAMRQTVLELECDGEPCVWAPLDGLFPGHSGVYTDWYRSTDADGVMTLRFVMPVQHHATWRFTHYGTQPVTLTWGLTTTPWTWDDCSMYFHAGWAREFPIHTAKAKGTRDWNYVAIAGTGTYVGDSLSVMNPVAAWWGEGDEKIYVDCEKFPSHFGTGTEDYYGYAWCWPEPFQHPFHAQPRADGWAAPGKKWTNHGRTNVTRVRSLDAIPFKVMFRFNMEVWHWAECDEEYAATTYWYARPGSSSTRSGGNVQGVTQGLPHIPPLPRPMTIAGAVECETAKITAKTPGLVTEAQDLEGFAKNAWSDASHLWVRAGAIGDFVELALPAPNDNPNQPRALTLYATKSWDYGIIRLTVSGQPAGESIDLYSGTHGKALPSGPIALGTFSPVNGTFTLRAEVVGSNEKSAKPKYYFGLDAVVIK